MNKDYTLFGLLLFPVLIVQIYIVPFISIEQIAPNLPVILLTFYTLKKGQVPGALLAFITGFFYDLISAQLIGSSMFSLTLAAFVTGYLYTEIRAESFVKTGRFPLGCTLFAILHIFVYSLLTAFDMNMKILDLVIRMTILPAVYTAVIAMIVSSFFPKKYLTV